MKTLLSLAAVLAALLAPSTAGAAVVHIDAGASGRGFTLSWHADYDTVAKTVTVDAEYTNFDGSPTSSQPQTAVAIFTAPNGVQRAFGLGPTTTTTVFDNGDVVTVDPLIAKSDGQPGILNKGPQVYSVPGGLRVSANRAGLVDFETDFLP